MPSDASIDDSVVSVYPKGRADSPRRLRVLRWLPQEKKKIVVPASRPPPVPQGQAVAACKRCDGNEHFLETCGNAPVPGALPAV